jgi:hypothetical protein
MDLSWLTRLVRLSKNLQCKITTLKIQHLTFIMHHASCKNSNVYSLVYLTFSLHSGFCPKWLRIVPPLTAPALCPLQGLGLKLLQVALRPVGLRP